MVFPASVASFVLRRLAFPRCRAARGPRPAVAAPGEPAAAARLAPVAEKSGAQNAGDPGISWDFYAIFMGMLRDFYGNFLVKLTFCIGISWELHGISSL